MPSVKKLVAGLGNPGTEYRNTRHNFGFMALDALGEKFHVKAYYDKFDGKYARVLADGVELHLIKPQTYMNLSGRAVAQTAKKFSIQPKDILVIHDDVDLPLGKIKWKIGGGNAGHNGLKSVTEVLGNNDYCRLRLGVGRPLDNTDLAKYVLSPFSRDEMPDARSVLENCIEMIDEQFLKGNG